MRVAVINETSAGNRNEDILHALAGLHHEVINAGMRQKGGNPELQYTHTGFLTALLLHTNRVDFVIGGCGTGQGYLNSVMQYPGVFCGHILTPLDAMLFARINGGNCISLALNQGYGWAADVNLSFIFERLFAAPFGAGYPPERAEPQQRSREALADISRATHRSFAEIVTGISRDIVREALDFPGIRDLVRESVSLDAELTAAFVKQGVQL